MLLQYRKEATGANCYGIPCALLALVVFLKHWRLAVFSHVFSKDSKDGVALSANMHMC